MERFKDLCHGSVQGTFDYPTKAILGNSGLLQLSSGFGATTPSYGSSCATVKSWSTCSTRRLEFRATSGLVQILNATLTKGAEKSAPFFV